MKTLTKHLSAVNGAAEPLTNGRGIPRSADSSFVVSLMQEKGSWNHQQKWIS